MPNTRFKFMLEFEVEGCGPEAQAKAQTAIDEFKAGMNEERMKEGSDGIKLVSFEVTTYEA